MGIITLLTDFGSFYPSVMKAVILSIAPSANVIDITHDVTPQNVTEGSFILRETVKYFPRGTVHVAVVDPTVGTERRGLVVEAGGQYLVGPDNGLLIPAARYLGEVEAMAIDMQAKSHTFHGRDVFAPISALLSIGIMEHLTKTSYYVDSMIEEPSVREEMVVGKVLYVDRFGNCVTNISGSTMTSRTDFGGYHTLNNSVTLRSARTYDYGTGGELLLVVGSFDLIEIAMNRGSAAQSLNLQVGDNITIDF
jgi:S-adenosylmethionine hydrolase